MANLAINGKTYSGKSLHNLKWQVEEARLHALAERFDAQQKAEEQTRLLSQAYESAWAKAAEEARIGNINTVAAEKLLLEEVKEKNARIEREKAEREELGNLIGSIREDRRNKAHKYSYRKYEYFKIKIARAQKLAEERMVADMLERVNLEERKRKAVRLCKQTKLSYERKTTNVEQIVLSTLKHPLTKQPVIKAYSGEVVRFNVKNVIEACGGYGMSMRKCLMKTGGVVKRMLNNNLIEVVLDERTAKQCIDVIGLDSGKIYCGTLSSGTLSHTTIEGTKVVPIDQFKGNVYAFVAFSSNGTKTRTYYAMKVHGTKDEMTAMLVTALNKMTEYGYELIAGSTGTVRSLIKLVSRICLSMTPAKTMFTWSYDCGRSLALYMGKFTHDNVEGFDGEGFESAEAKAELMSKLYGTEVSVDVAKLCWSQIRFAQVKGMTAALPQERLNDLVNEYGKDHGMIRIENPTEQDVQDVHNGKYKGKVVIVGKGDPFAFFDMNCVKVTPNFVHSIDYRIAALAKASDSSTNVQMCQAVASTQEGVALIAKLAMEHIDAKIERFKNACDAKYPVRISDLESGYLGNIVPSMNPKFMFENAALFKTAFKNMLNSVENDINNLNFDLPTKYLKVMGDIAGLFGCRILGDTETYMPILKAGETVDAIRCPKSETHDHAVLANVGIREIERRIHALDISEVRKAIMLSYYHCVPTGVAVLPWTQAIKNDLGGMDYDGDGIIIVLNKGIGKEWNAVAAKIKVGAAEIDGKEENPGTDKIKTVNPAVVVETFYAGCNSDNLDIGRVNNYTSLVASVCQSNDVRVLRKLQEAMDIGFGCKKYERFITESGQKIGCDELRKIEELGFAYNFSNIDDLRDFLSNDFLGTAPVMYGLVIDASKKYYNVTVLFWNNFVNSSIQFVHVLKKRLYKFNLVSDNGIDKVTLSNINNYKKDSRKSEIVEVHCPLSDLKSAVAEYATGALHNVLALQNVSDDERNMKFFIEQTYSLEIEIMKGVRKQYADYGALLAKATDESDRKCIKRHINDIVNNGRRLTSHLTLAQRGEVVRFVSVVMKDGQFSDTKHSSFMNAFVPEMIALLLFKEDSVKICGEEILLHDDIDNCIGTVAKFINGRSKVGISLGKDISGMFLIEKYEDKFFATMPIENALEDDSIMTKDVEMDKVAFKVQGKALDNIRNIRIDDEVILSNNKTTVFVNKIDKAYGGADIKTTSTGIVSYVANEAFAVSYAYTAMKITGVEFVKVTTNSGSEETVALVTGTALGKVDKYIGFQGKTYSGNKKAVERNLGGLSASKEGSLYNQRVNLLEANC